MGRRRAAGRHTHARADARRRAIRQQARRGTASRKQPTAGKAAQQQQAADIKGKTFILIVY
uniref:Uncharacterized protein n=1 Tax=Oryza punctata TaxID=4537 RepID=A0A0E0KW40_ORYPU